ncbi:hypothetical protein PCANB_001386 [Pneumocystis canis]|nr:hypothetical protein PCANB_001386 [Pneumocystis canis]
MSRDRKFFIKEKVQKLKSRLINEKKDKKHTRRKATLKKIIANMLMSNDMSSLFPDIIQCMEIPVLEIKKMSLRTMSYINIKEFTDSIVMLLHQLLSDSDPYVRKTGAMCVAKLYYTNRNIVEENNLIDELKKKLNDTNSIVVSSSLLSLSEIIGYSDSIKLDISTSYANKLVNMLDECAEYITLLSKEPEIKYVALKNAQIILQRIPEILENDINVFFCKYNDPLYIKLTKLEIITKLVNEENMNQVLAEFKDSYTAQIDVDFVKKSIQSIGYLAIKFQSIAEECVGILVTLIETKIHYIVEESILVIKDIFRKYPDEYNSIISTLCNNLDCLSNPEAKAAMIWIIGQYSTLIKNAYELLNQFFSTFINESLEVQFALLTASVKLFIEQSSNNQNLVLSVLKKITENTNNPDLRDRAYMYWRLLSEDRSAAKRIIMGKKPTITFSLQNFDQRTLDELCLNLGSLSNIYYKTPSQLIPGSKVKEIQNSRALRNRLNLQKSLSQ